MNTYDPSDYIRYVTMDRTLGPSSSARADGGREQRLPRGYANASPATRLRSRSAVRADGGGRMPAAVATPGEVRCG